TPDAMEASQLHDWGNQINAFEARLMKMKIFFTESLISVPQIRVAQEAAKIEIQNIMDGLLFDLPRLKNAVLRVASLLNIRGAQQENDARREASAKIGQLGADLLHTAYTEAKSSQGSSLDEVNALSDIANKLVGTIQAGAEIERQNQAKRAEANRKLVEVKNTVAEVMRDIGPVDA
ncbi:MAG: toxic anion resistance protein, partial [Rhodospirillaceae bacterium]